MTGQVVFGDDYFPRKKDEDRVWRRLLKGGHLLLLAPRRVGKTSLLRHLEDNPKEGFIFLYVMVQSCKSENELYKQILEDLYSSEFTQRLEQFTHKSKKIITSVFSSIDAITWSETGITFKNPDFQLTASDLEKVIVNLKLNQKLVLILDEYPDVLEKIEQNSGKETATDFLANTRKLCLNKELIQKVQFIFTGSIGLDTLANRLGSTGLINDRDKVAIEPFTHEIALEFISFLKNKNQSRLSLDQSIADYLLKKVEWLMPYYIEALWLRLEDLCYDNDIANPGEKHVDEAFELLFHRNYRTTFNHWAERLNRFNKNEKKLAKMILDKLSATGELSYGEVYNIFQEDTFEGCNGNFILDCLEHDGYLFEHQEKSFKFTSPILKEWWRRYADRTL